MLSNIIKQIPQVKDYRVHEGNKGNRNEATAMLFCSSSPTFLFTKQFADNIFCDSDYK